MIQVAEVPARLYKYRKFDQKTLELLVTDQLYFANPKTFNDPLDARPSVSADLDDTALERALGSLVASRVRAEMSSAAKSIKKWGPKTKEHIERLSQEQAWQIIESIAYNATDPYYEIDNPHTYLLSGYLEDELLKRYDKGIVSFSELGHCPLMWSHYGDQHQGICLGYSVPRNREIQLRQVDYGGSRLVAASDIVKMLQGEPEARDRVDQAVLFRKAQPWEYEKEWRLIGTRGPQDSCLELEEITFGMRCSSAVRYAVVKALDGRAHPIKYYVMREVTGTFELAKRDLDFDEEYALWPRRALSDQEAFDQMLNLDVTVTP